MARPLLEPLGWGGQSKTPLPRSVHRLIDHHKPTQKATESYMRSRLQLRQVLEIGKGYVAIGTINVPFKVFRFLQRYRSLLHMNIWLILQDRLGNHQLTNTNYGRHLVSESVLHVRLHIPDFPTRSTEFHSGCWRSREITGRGQSSPCQKSWKVFLRHLVLAITVVSLRLCPIFRLHLFMAKGFILCNAQWISTVGVMRYNNGLKLQCFLLS